MSFIVVSPLSLGWIPIAKDCLVSRSCRLSSHLLRISSIELTYATRGFESPSERCLLREHHIAW